MAAESQTLLVVNLHFAPYSFGGGTVVAENMALELANRYGWRVIVITTHSNPKAQPYSMTRYAFSGIEVFSIVIPDEGALTYQERYDNPGIGKVVERIIERLDIDIAHVHCIQGMGVGIFDALKGRNVPFVTTVHDCWWFCERMFMINIQGRYCHQRAIDMNVCRYCVNDVNEARTRKRTLFQALSDSTALLFPSRFHCDLYIDNGFCPEKCLVNKNGVRLPPDDALYDDVSKKPSNAGGVVRFGFVGGPGDIKGAPLIRKAFTDLPSYSNYRLVLVDGAQNRGLTWAKSFDWKLPGELDIVPPYNRDSMEGFFSSIDVLLFPSQWKESFGLTVREAIARGVWVIVTDAGGVAEDCVEGVNANIIPMDGDYRPLKEAIEAILSARHAPVVKDRNVVSVARQAAELNTILSNVSRE